MCKQDRHKGINKETVTLNYVQKTADLKLSHMELSDKILKLENCFPQLKIVNQRNNVTFMKNDNNSIACKVIEFIFLEEME